MSSNSTNKALLVPAQGDFPGSWGTQVSSNTFTPIDSCFGAQTALAAADHSISTSETQSPIHNISGTLSADITITYPASKGGFYIVENATSGAHTVTVTYSGGSGVVVPQTSRALIKIDPSETAAKFAAAPDVLTTRGDIMTRDANTYSRLAVGSAGQVLKSDGTDISWGSVSVGTIPIDSGGTGQITAAAAFNALAPTTTRGDIIIRNASTNTRLAVGSSGQVLTTDGTDVSWGAVSIGTVAIASGGTGQVTATAAFNALSPLTTQGDILYFNGTNNVRLGPGTSGQFLKTNGAGANPAWANSTVSGTVAIANGGTGQTTAATAALAIAESSAASFSALSAGMSGLGTSATKITFNASEEYDVGGYYDLANSKWTPPAGKVLINVSLQAVSVAIGTQAAVMIYKNGSERRRVDWYSGGVTFGMSITAMDTASGTDYFEVYALGDASWSINGGAAASIFQGTMV